jgi:hypothetical protein
MYETFDKSNFEIRAYLRVFVCLQCGTVFAPMDKDQALWAEKNAEAQKEYEDKVASYRTGMI